MSVTLSNLTAFAEQILFSHFFVFTDFFADQAE